MKEVYLFRHSIKFSTGDSNISPEGFALAVKMGSSLFRGKKFTRYYVSPLQRTSETMDAFLDGIGSDRTSIEYDIFPPHTAGTTEVGMRMWNGVCHEAEKVGQDMMHVAMQEDRNSALRIAENGSTIFREWFDSLEENENILVVGHSPLIEMIVYGLFGIELRQLQYCEGVYISGESSRDLQMKELRR